MSANPFDDLDLDPLSAAEAITERLRERIEDAAPAGRQAIRDVWEDLTLHPRRRVALALATFVDPEPEAIVPPSAARPPSPEQRGPELDVAVSDLHASLAREGLMEHEPTGYVPIASDPLLGT